MHHGNSRANASTDNVNSAEGSGDCLLPCGQTETDLEDRHTALLQQLAEVRFPQACQPHFDSFFCEYPLQNILISRLLQAAVILGFPGAVMLLTCTLTIKSFKTSNFDNVYKLMEGVLKHTYVTLMLLQCCQYHSGKDAVVTIILLQLLGPIFPCCMLQQTG